MSYRAGAEDDPDWIPPRINGQANQNCKDSACAFWREKHVNPFTRRKIRPGGYSDRMIQTYCNGGPLPTPYEKAGLQPLCNIDIGNACEMFRDSNRTFNPFSGRAINPNGLQAMRYWLKCGYDPADFGQQTQARNPHRRRRRRQHDDDDDDDDAGRQPVFNMRVEQQPGVLPEDPQRVWTAADIAANLRAMGFNEDQQHTGTPPRRVSAQRESPKGRSRSHSNSGSPARGQLAALGVNPEVNVDPNTAPSMSDDEWLLNPLEFGTSPGAADQDPTLFQFSGATKPKKHSSKSPRTPVKKPLPVASPAVINLAIGRAVKAAMPIPKPTRSLSSMTRIPAASGGLEVKTATLPWMGNGLFVKKDFAAGSILCAYGGDLISHRELLKRYGSKKTRPKYVILVKDSKDLSKRLYRDAERETTALGRYANTASTLKKLPLTNNAKLSINKSDYTVYVKAARKILKGEEILVSV